MPKKILSVLLCLLLVLLNLNEASFIYAEDDEDTSENEGCVINGEEFTYEECQQMYEDARNKVKEKEKEIENAKDDKEAKEELANKYAKEAEGMQEEIDSLATQINELKVRIEELETQIAENEALVEALNTRVKNRMVNSQKTMHFNGYLEFILGSKSFTDMLRRIYGVEAVVSKDKADREDYIEIITQLTNDKKELDESKSVLDESYKELVTKQEELKVMQEYYEQQAAEIQEELDRMNEEKDNVYESFSTIANAVRNAGISVSTDFVACVHNSWISAGVWNYSSDFLDGKWHLGVDYAASRYTEVHAPATGVIVRASSSCPDVNKSYVFDSCGVPLGGGGNQIYMMCEVDGKVYGFIFMHLNSLKVSVGDFVLQDDVIALVGSSGQSTGPHCHIEMYELGSGTLDEYLDMSWNVTWSCGRGRTAYNNRCYYNDGSRRQSAPCILNPEWYLPGA